MELTRQRKVFIGILALAGVALALDQLVFSGEALGPSSASADMVQSSPDAQEASEAKVRQPKATAQPLAHRIEALAPTIDPSSTAEAFNSTPSWLNAKVQGAAPDRQAGNERDFEITTMFNSGKASFVNIGRKVVRLGESHQGWTLTSVDSKAGVAVFSDGTRQREIRQTQSRR